MFFSPGVVVLPQSQFAQSMKSFHPRIVNKSFSTGSDNKENQVKFKIFF